MERSTFDAMTTDGSGNYMKLVVSESGFEVADSKLRSYREGCQKELQPWIVNTYRNDQMCDLPPVVEDNKLLKLDPAIDAARRCLDHSDDVDEVLLPLGMSLKTYQCYKIIKTSGFIFQTPKQYKAIQKTAETLQRKIGIGLDLPILRRRHKDRGKGSLVAHAEALYAYIQTGAVNFSREFNLREDRLSKAHRSILNERKINLQELRDDAIQELLNEIDVEQLSQYARLTGLRVSHAHLRHLADR